MSNIKDIQIPTMNNIFPKESRDYPISEGENLMRALNHEKPLWMPNFEGSSQDIMFGFGNPGKLKDGDTFVNLWGVTYQFSEAQGSATPITKAFSEVSKWKEELKWPDVNDVNVEKPEGFARDENLLVCGHLNSACFENMHMLEGFEQTLIDLITEPQATRELYEAMVDFNLEVFHKLNGVYHFDYILYHDDWGTQRGPFFSLDLFKETILGPTIRLAEEVKKTGVKFFFHNCGLINDFMPYIVDEIKPDGIQPQNINDIEGWVKKYGDKVTVEYRRPDLQLLFDPETTVAQVKELARWVVDTFGAHVNPGSGAVTTINAPTADVYNTFDEEMYQYSLEKYRGQ